MKEVLNKKTIIIVSIIILVLIICIFVMKNIGNTTSGYIVLDDYIVEYNADEYKEANLEEVKDYKFRMIYDNAYLGDYKYDHKDESTNRMIFKDDEGIYALKTPLLGLDSNTDLIDFQIETMNEDDFNLYKSLFEEDINYKLTDLSYAEKAIINNNGIIINIYSVKYEGESEKDDRSILFASIDNETYIIDKDYPVEDETGYVFYSFNVMYVIDINKDNNYELVVAKSHYDVTDYSIYRLDSNFLELYYTGK